MIKTILASLTGLGSDKTVLEAALAVAAIDNAHVDCLHTRVDALEGAALVNAATPGIHTLRKTVQRIAEEEQERSQHSRIEFQNACKRHSLTSADSPAASDKVSIALRDITTLLNETLHQSRFYDLVVLAREAGLSSERLHSLIMQAGRPVLIAPDRPSKEIGRVVVVAWKDTAEAARALAAALPILLHARRIVVLSISQDTIGDDTDRDSAEAVGKQLLWHGIKADVQICYTPTVSVAKTMQTIAYECDADLLVMGAYGHSRMRESIFGGATRDVLSQFELPVMMVH